MRLPSFDCLYFAYTSFARFTSSPHTGRSRNERRSATRWRSLGGSGKAARPPGRAGPPGAPRRREADHEAVPAVAEKHRRRFFSVVFFSWRTSNRSVSFSETFLKSERTLSGRPNRLARDAADGRGRSQDLASTASMPVRRRRRRDARPARTPAPGVAAPRPAASAPNVSLADVSRNSDSQGAASWTSSVPVPAGARRRSAEHRASPGCAAPAETVRSSLSRDDGSETDTCLDERASRAPRRLISRRDFLARGLFPTSPDRH